MSTLTETLLALGAMWGWWASAMWHKHRTLRDRRWVYEEADDRAYWEQLAEWWYGDDAEGLRQHQTRVHLAVLVANLNDILPRAVRRYRARGYVWDGLRTWGNW